ncbi:hypothetical protein [Arthrobacter bambusae]|uniref:VWA domain-containing protein n=1 Tax=Arthrobacter bambusae TaxID=1338426 RepID=A0AAW8DGG7_9MICC|nr:hypothetical protein [Arthrobacter bambusae]MDP9904757.1 hypothetical protein [Arthrobacter bambusae]MDQ0129573.1 hypothetical protein [Arthrobacter bambusae]MDQ0180814.1 hypothetical protein [Arthrobacter bambusae]
MTITVTNQKPAVLDPVHTITCTGTYDPMPAITSAIADPLRTPLNPGAPANITDAKGLDLSSGIEQALLACLGDTLVPGAEDFMKELLGQTMVNYDQTTPLPVGELFAAQAGRKHKLPAPVPGKVVYTAREDVIPSAKGLLSGSNDADLFFASLAYAYHPDTLGFWFQSEAAFDDFKAWLAQQVQTSGSALPAGTLKLLGDFAALELKSLTESLLLRQDDTDNNEELSFARLVVHLLMQYVEQLNAQQAGPGGTPATSGVLPFTVGELFCPKSLVFVNVEAHARARPGKVTAEWGIINQSLSSPVKVVSNKNLSKLTAMHRATARAQAQAATQQAGAPATRSAQVVFRKQAPTKLDLFAALTRVLKRMGKVNRSQNIFRKSKTTFLKANRRDPDDYNKPGRITSVSYMPDIHIYVDTSGSITEANYQEAVLMLIKIAKKLNVNLYFNSFSHVLSQETLLKVENKSVTQIWQEFRKVPKVDGGTDYKQIWDYINASAVRKRRLSLVITDFEWRVPSTREDHPKNLYYAPCGAMDWDSMVRSAKHFAKAMKHIDPAVPQRLLGMIV